MARRDEATVKVTADTKDVQRAFEQLDQSYSRVAKASEEYARAVEQSAKAVTREEKKAAKEVEQATRQILAAEKRRTSAMKARANALEKQAQALKKTTAIEKDAAKSSGGLAGKTDKLAGSMNLVAGAIGAVAFGAAKLIGDYATLDAATGRLENSFRSAGASTDAMAQAEALATEMARRGQATRLDSINSIRELTDASGDATKALSDYRLAVDIASQANIGVEAATKLVARARNGEVEELKQLRGINKDLAADLNRVEDATTRSELAINLLSASYDGAAQANAGLIDKQNAMRFSVDDLGASIGDLGAAIGEGATGVVGSLGQFFGVLEEGQDPVTALTSGFKGFADAIREAKQPVQDMIEAGGALGAIFSGRSVFEVISDADTRRALANKGKPGEPEKKEEEQKKKLADTTGKLNDVLKKQDEAKKKLSGSTNKLAQEKERLRKADEEAIAALERDLILEEEAARIYNEEAEALDRLNQVKAESKRLQDETLTRLEQELEIRQMNESFEAEGGSSAEIEALKIQQELERELFDIRRSGMSWESKARAEQIAQRKASIATARLEADQEAENAKKRKAAINAAAEATATLGAAALEQAGLANAAIALESGQKAAYYTGESIAEFAAYNIPGGIGFAAAAAQHALVAGGAIIGGLNGGGSRGGGGATTGTPADTAPRTLTAPTVSEAQAREQTIVLNQNMLGYLPPDDARRVSSAEARLVRSKVGGRR